MEHIKQFWNLFSQQELEKAQEIFSALNKEQQLSIFQALFQHSAFKKAPFLISVLEKKLDNDHDFKDFYQAWLPEKNAQNSVEVAGEYFLQTFQAPVRVFNGVDINNPKRVISVGLTWIRNTEEEQGLWQYLKKAEQGDDAVNQQRSEKIDTVADGQLFGLFRVESDDNLGTPF